MFGIPAPAGSYGHEFEAVIGEAVHTYIHYNSVMQECTQRLKVSGMVIAAACLCCVVWQPEASQLMSLLRPTS